MSTLSSVPEEPKIGSKIGSKSPEETVNAIARKILISYGVRDTNLLDDMGIASRSLAAAAKDIEALINQQIKSVLDTVEKELHLDEGSDEPHFSHVCPKNNIECAEFAQRLQTRHWQGLAIQKIRSRYE